MGNHQSTGSLGIEPSQSDLESNSPPWNIATYAIAVSFTASDGDLYAGSLKSVTSPAQTRFSRLFSNR